MLKIFKYLKAKEWYKIILGFLFIAVQVYMDLKIPDYMAQVTRLVKMPGNSIVDIWREGFWMLLCTLGSFLSALIVGFIAARVGASFSRRMRSLVFTKVNSFSAKEISFFSTASLITRSTNDIGQLRMFITRGLQVIVKAPIMAIWAVSKISGKGLEWSLITASAVLFLVIVIVIVMALLLPKFRKIQRLIDDVNRVARENLIGLPLIRAYNASDYQEGKFEEVNENLKKTQLFTSRGMAFMNPMMSFIMSILSMSIYWSGAYMINAASSMDRFVIFSNMIVFSSYAMQVIMSFMMLAMVFVMWPRASVSARRINELMDTEPSIVFGKKESSDINSDNIIEFKNVSFKYPGSHDYVLKGISFKLKRGETLAIIGSTGSGKTSLVNLLLRFFDTDKGQIILEGSDIKDYSEKWLYKKIAYVTQKVSVFRASVKNNVAYGEKEVDMERVKKSLELAQGKDFVESLEDSYDFDISQAGANLSGGQRQRIAIARALNRQADIYIFDDSFSALDYKTDLALRRALKEEMKGITSIIVAQRVGTIMHADKIIVIHEGKIVGKGRHQDLIKNCHIYKEIVESQINT